ncbi:GDP-mannose 4,6-dehydratase [Mucilaginibacter calamicampi]|uniref:GDP-mannose 4,6-dehydratase n=1 Tax=Mucilaginibacter calamicampi TaxID=1302352 RepID=A0ABW2YSS0_9SPHI
MNKKALIFGINGQDGYYLNRLLADHHITVIGVSRSGLVDIKGDVTDYLFVSNLIKEQQPDYIFHLAANSTTRHDALFENFGTICTGTLNILEAAYQHCPGSRIFISGSGLQFENKGAPISENHAFEARDAYSMARIQSAFAARYYRTKGMKVYTGYFFNHDSPLRSDRHINQKIALSAHRIYSGRDDKLSIGDVSVKKEFTYAGDVVNAIWVLVNNDTVFEATIGSGLAFPISDWLQLCFSRYDLDWRDHVAITPGFVAEYEVLVADPSTIKGLGWQPQLSISGLADMMLEHVEKTDVG